MTIAQQLNYDFSKGSFKLYDSNGKEIYYETSNGHWAKYEYDSTGKVIYFEDSEGIIKDNRPKANCSGKTVIVDGVEYELKEKK